MIKSPPFPFSWLARGGGERAYNYGGMAPKGGLNFRKKVSLFYGKAMGVALPGKKLPGKPLLFDLAPNQRQNQVKAPLFATLFFFLFCAAGRVPEGKGNIIYCWGKKGKEGT